MCVIFADAYEINLQLEGTICFISQGKSNAVDLQMKINAEQKQS